ncbi:MAG: thioredoxin family protein [Aliarcobacter sp.]|jgi:thioredoxin-like negative regulator of GroEL|nr:thioredoxin family protein [Aliarcobacter sp.]
MIIIDNLQQLLNNINTGEPVLVYFSGENCSVCKVLKPKIEEEVLKQFPKFKLFEVKTDLNKEITSHFTVFSIPTTLIFFDTKEFQRVGRNMSVALFIEELKRPYNLMCED